MQSLFLMLHFLSTFCPLFLFALFSFFSIFLPPTTSSPLIFLSSLFSSLFLFHFRLLSHYPSLSFPFLYFPYSLPALLLPPTFPILPSPFPTLPLFLTLFLFLSFFLIFPSPIPSLPSIPPL